VFCGGGRDGECHGEETLTEYGVMRPHLIDSTKSPLIRHGIPTAIMVVAKTARLTLTMRVTLSSGGVLRWCICRFGRRDKHG
jgi:hypothetical protein